MRRPEAAAGAGDRQPQERLATAWKAGHLDPPAPPAPHLAVTLDQRPQVRPFGLACATRGIVSHPRQNRGFSSTICTKQVGCSLSIVGSIKSRSRESIKMDSTRKISLIAGVLYLLTFVSIPTLFLYNAVRGANYLSLIHI